MSDVAEMAAFIREQIDADEWWAREASRSSLGGFTPTGEHWRWECETTDQPVAIDPVLSQHVEGHDHSSVGLRSVEEYESSVGPLSHLVISNQDDLSTTVAGHIERHDPADVLAVVAAHRAILDLWEDVMRNEDHHAGWVANEAVRLVATAYSARDGFRQEWLA